MISEEDKDRVRAATDLVALVQETVELKPRGHEFWCCCPFHGEKTPSFHIIPSTQVWHCFGCGEGGDCFTYIMKRENLSFPEAIRYLADRAGIEISDDASSHRTGTKRNRLIEVCEETSRFYHMLLMRGKDARGREYCKRRALDAATCTKYRLGFAPGRGALVAHLSQAGFTPREMIDANVAFQNRKGGLVDRFFDRVMFPIFDEQGRCIAFGGRALDKDKTPAKYLNTSETPIFHKGKNLYGFNWAKEHIVADGEVVVVEGYISAMSCWKAGIENIVAVLGTALTETHVRTLARFTKRIVYMFDGDAAGQKAARRAIQFIEKDDIDLRCVTLPGGMDPDDYVRSEGADKLRGLIAASEPLMDFVFRKLEEESDIATPGGRAKAMRSALELIYPLRASYMIDGYYMQIADRLGLDVDAVRENAGRVFREVQQKEQQEARRERQRDRARADRDPGREVEAPRPRTAAAAPLPPVDDTPPYDDVPADYFPEGGGAPVARPDAAPTGPGSPGVSILTDLERRALCCERELLCLLASYPDSFRPFADRITAVEWVDPRSEAIAWSVLATPEGNDAAGAMAAARAVCPDAAKLVSAGTIASTSQHPTETNVVFLLDTLELYTARRRMRSAQARLRSDGQLSSDERRELAIGASRDAARIRELEKRVEGVADPFSTENPA